MPFDPDKFLKSRGVDPTKQTAPPTVPGIPPPTPDIPAASDDDHQDWAASRGLAKSVAGLGVGAGNLLGTMLPSLGTLARKYAPEGAKRGYERMREFSQEPSESWLETAGGFVPYLFGGELGLGNIAARGAAKVLPKAVPKFVPGQGFILGATPAVTRAGVKGAKVAGDVAGRSVTGALGGAAQNPDDPGTAALGGAIAGQVPAAAGAVMRSPIGHWAGGAALPAIVAHHFGAPAGEAIAGGLGVHFMAQNIRWHHSPIGKQLFRFGKWIVDQTGRIIGEIPGQAAGAVAGQAVGENAPDVASMARDVMQMGTD